MLQELLSLAAGFTGVDGKPAGGKITVSKPHFKAVKILADQQKVKLESKDIQDIGGGAVWMATPLFCSIVNGANRNFDLDKALAEAA